MAYSVWPDEKNEWLMARESYFLLYAISSLAMRSCSLLASELETPAPFANHFRSTGIVHHTAPPFGFTFPHDVIGPLTALLDHLQRLGPKTGKEVAGLSLERVGNDSSRVALLDQLRPL